jgi:hypothetical protein
MTATIRLAADQAASLLFGFGGFSEPVKWGLKYRIDGIPAPAIIMTLFRLRDNGCERKTGIAWASEVTISHQGITLNGNLELAGGKSLKDGSRTRQRG